MKKLLIGGFLFLIGITSVSAASQSVVLKPGWNTFSTPKVVTSVGFSNTNGAGLYFYQLTGSGWNMVTPNATNIKPLEGFVVNNTSTGNVSVNLEYKTGLTPSEMLFQKSLHAGWNFVGVTTETTPFSTIGSGSATMSVDFTRTNGGSNNLNSINSSFSTTSGNANIANPELTEAYAVFMPTEGLYAGSQDQVTTLSITRTDNLTNPSFPVGAHNVIVYSARISTNQTNSIQLTGLSATTTTTMSNTSGNISYTLYVNGTPVSTKAPQGVTASFDNFNVAVSDSQYVDIQIKADFADTLTNGTFGIASINYNAVDNVTKFVQTPATISGATFTVNQPIGTLGASTGDNLVNKSLLLAGSTNQKIASFKVTSSNDAIKLKTIAVSGTNLDSLSNIRLQDANGKTVSASSVTNTSASVENIDTAIDFGNTIDIDKTATYYVIADVNFSTDTSGIRANILVSGSQITSSNGAVISMTGTDVTGASHDVTQNSFKVTQVTPSNKDIATDAMEFRVDAFGKNSVTLTDATFSNLTSGYDVSAATLGIYRKSDNALVGQLSSTGTTGTVTFSANNTIDAGSSATYVVKIVGAIVDGASSSQGWTVSLTSLNVNTGVNVFNAASYTKNTDTLPLTSNK